MATHDSILVWEIPGRLQSMGSQRVRHNWALTHIVSYLIILWAISFITLIPASAPLVVSRSRNVYPLLLSEDPNCRASLRSPSQGLNGTSVFSKLSIVVITIANSYLSYLERRYGNIFTYNTVLNSQNNSKMKCCYFSHFTDEETEGRGYHPLSLVLPSEKAAELTQSCTFCYITSETSRTQNLQLRLDLLST